MKILLLTEFYPTQENKITGGVEARDFYLRQELIKKGQEIKVYSSNNSYVNLGGYLNRFLFFCRAILNNLRTDFDIVDANSAPTYPIAYILGKLKNKKVVYSIPDIVGTSSAIKYFGTFHGMVEGIIERLFLFLQPDAAISWSEATRSKILKIGYPAQKIVTIYPGQIARRMKIAKKYDLISVNRLVNYKQTDVAIRAVSKLTNVSKNFSFAIVGTGPEKIKLQNLVKSLNLEKHIFFLGNLSHEEVLRDVSGAKIFCLPSQIEGFGLATLEAMGQGLPFVNSNIDVHREIQAKSKAGVLFKAGDEIDLSEKILHLLTNLKFYDRLSKRALAFSHKYTWETHAKATLTVYENLLSH